MVILQKYMLSFIALKGGFQMPNNFRRAPRLYGKGQKDRNLENGRAIRSHDLESKIFCGLNGQCGA